MEKRNPAEYKLIKCIIRQEITKAKEKQLLEKSREIEYHKSMHDCFNVHKRVREAIGGKQQN